MAIPILPPPTNATFFICSLLSLPPHELGGIAAGKEAAKRRKLQYDPANRRTFRQNA
jgi:hypothetical protein